MKRLAALALTALASACVGAPDMAAIESEVTRFYERQAAGEDREIYRDAAAGLRDATSFSDLQQLNTAIRAADCGTARRDPAQWHNYMSTSGHFITVVYDRQCRDGALTETFRFIMTRNGPLVLNYYASGLELFPPAQTTTPDTPETAPNDNRALPAEAATTPT